MIEPVSGGTGAVGQAVDAVKSVGEGLTKVGSSVVKGVQKVRGSVRGSHETRAQIQMHRDTLAAMAQEGRENRQAMSEYLDREHGHEKQMVDAKHANDMAMLNRFAEIGHDSLTKVKAGSRVTFKVNGHEFMGTSPVPEKPKNEAPAATPVASSVKPVRKSKAAGSSAVDVPGTVKPAALDTKTKIMPTVRKKKTSDDTEVISIGGIKPAQALED
jgi:hypothetical protein